MFDLPALPGAYVLELFLPQDADLAIGRLGRACFPRGAMLYAGSARGPGGLKARLGRHLQNGSVTHPHWHIDALRGIAQARAAAYWVSPEPALECLWSHALAQLPGSCIPLAGFGASDCRLGCPAHLVAFPGEEKDNHPMLERFGWLQSLAQVAGVPPPYPAPPYSALPYSALPYPALPYPALTIVQLPG
jgi:Uri superfamily endonuclease